MIFVAAACRGERSGWLMSDAPCPMFRHLAVVVQAPLSLEQLQAESATPD